MALAEILLIAVGLATDAFAVSVGVAAGGGATGPRPVFRLSFHFGLFQLLMPILGWFLGSTVAAWIDGWDHWLAAALLALVGIRMARAALDGDRSLRTMGDPSRGRTLVMLSVATSIDAFAVGLGLAMLQVNILYPSIVIGVVTSGLSLAGLGLGARLRQGLGKQIELVGGLILFAIALRILLSGSS